MIIQNLDFLVNVCEQERKNWKTIGLTNWCFDLLHPWHIHTFRESKKLCDILVVAVNGDVSPYWKNKPWRPINDEFFRTEMLDSIKFIDYICIFNQETPKILISKIMPNILIKWWDYRVEEVVWYQEVINNWGKVIIIPTLHGYSTTNIVQKLKK